MTVPTSEEEPIGSCILVIDEERELICGQPGVAEVLVRNDFGLFAVPICLAHQDQHKVFYQVLNRRRGPRRARVKARSHT